MLDERSTDAEVREALEKAKKADFVIASLYGRVRTGQARSVGLPEPGEKALAALIGSKKPLVGVSFGNPYLLQSFPKLKTYVVAYGDMPSLQQATARALLGQIDITGNCRFHYRGFYPRGNGYSTEAGAERLLSSQVLHRSSSAAHKSVGKPGPLSYLSFQIYHCYLRTCTHALSRCGTDAATSDRDLVASSLNTK